MSVTPAKQPQWHTKHSMIIPHPAEPRLLLLPGEAGWSLPCIELDERKWVVEVGHLRPALLRLLGIDATVLRCAYAHIERTAARSDAIFETENHSPAWAPPSGGIWAGRAELAGLALAQLEHRQTIIGWLDEAETGVLPSQRPGWARRGWLAATTTWIEEQLARSRHALAAPVEQMKSCGISCILRARTAHGDAYFKAVPPLFAQEPAITQALAERYPDNIPIPIAIDAARSWMLLWDFGPNLRDNADIAVWEEMLRRFSAIQRDSAGHLEELRAAGCSDRGLELLATQIDPLLDEVASQKIIRAAEIRRLRAHIPRLKAMCEQLAGCRLPPTLVHGDLHPGNIAFQDGRPIFFDWTDACIGHPFLDIATVLDEIGTLSDVPDARTRLRDVYLAAWAGDEPLDRLAEAFELGATLGALHQAVSYRNIIAALEPSSRHEVASGLPYWLRAALKGVEGDM